MVTVPCYWRRWWMRIAFEEPAIERPTGSMWGRLLGVVGWIGSTRLTVTPSKTFTSIRYSAMQDNGSAPIPPGKSIPSPIAFALPSSTSYNNSRTMAISHSYTIAPTVLNEGRFGFAVNNTATTYGFDGKSITGTLGLQGLPQ